MELQTELDKLDSLRKNWWYFTLKREELIKNASPPEDSWDYKSVD